VPVTWSKLLLGSVYCGGPSESIPRSFLVCHILNTCSPSLESPNPNIEDLSYFVCRSVMQMRFLTCNSDMLSPRRWHVGHCASHVFCIFTLSAVLCIFNLAAFQIRIPPHSRTRNPNCTNKYLYSVVKLEGKGGVVLPPGTAKWISAINIQICLRLTVFKFLRQINSNAVSEVHSRTGHEGPHEKSSSTLSLT